MSGPEARGRSGFLARLRRLPGIGPQKCRNIVAQLEGKVAKYALLPREETPKPPPRADGDEVSALVRDVLGPAVADGADWLTGPDPEGWQRLRVTLPWPTEVPRRLLGLGTAAEVLDPAEMRAAVSAEAGAVAAAYRDGGPETP